MLDLLSFFRQASGMSYCLVKMPEEFPRYLRGESLELFCYSPAGLASKLLDWGKGYVQGGGRIRVSDVYKKEHLHVDFLRDGEIEFRFDLYGRLPEYHKLLIRPALFESIVEHARLRTFEGEGGAVPVRVPAPVDDALIRYLEFMEFYDVRPAKIKHLEYVCAGFDAATQERFLEKLHHYTKLPPVFVPHECPFCRFTGRIKKYLPG